MHAKKFYRFLLLSVVFLIFAHVFLQGLSFLLDLPERSVGAEIVNRFDVDDENSIPTWYSVTLLTLAAAICVLIGKQRHTTHSDKPQKKYWYVLSGALVFMSLDEMIGIHEWVLGRLHHLLKNGEYQGWFAQSWLALIIPVILVACIVFYRFLKNLPRRTTYLLLVSAAIYLSGLVVVEMISGPYRVGGGFFYESILVGLEEALELAGISTLLYSLIDYVEKNHHQLMKRILLLVRN